MEKTLNIIDITIDEYMKLYINNVGHEDNIELSGSENEYFFSAADGNDEVWYIRNQPWSFAEGDIDELDPSSKYYRIGERLYEDPEREVSTV